MTLFAVAISLFLSAAMAAPSEVQKRAVTEFDVSSFSAGCAATGGCSLSFDLVEAPATSSIQCTHTVPSVTTFPDRSGTVFCSDAAVQYQLQKLGNQYRLLIIDVHDPGNSQSGSKLWPTTTFPVVDDGQGPHQVYTGDSSFIIIPNA